MMKRLSAPLYIIVIIRAFFKFDAGLSCLTLPCSLRFSYFKLLVAGVCEQDLEECKILLNRDETLKIFMHNFLKLNIYYEDLNYEEIQEGADIEIAQILSDVGGAIGLWIGLSVVSFCEILQLIVELIKLTSHKMEESKRERRRKRSPKRKLDDVAIPREVIHLDDAVFTNFDCVSEVDSNYSSSAYIGPNRKRIFSLESAISVQ